MLTLFIDEILKCGNNLIEGSCYYIMNIKVKPGRNNYNIVHEYQPTLAKDATIVEVKEPCLKISFYAYYLLR